MSRKPNVVLVTVDSLRADHVGCSVGDAQPSLTPNLDALAAESRVFTQAFAQGPYTTFSLPSLFTGRYPCRLKPMGRALRWEQAAGVVVEGTPTLPERLRAAGYHTAGFHSNPLVSRLFGFDRGFDAFYDDVMFSERSLPSRLKLWAARLQRLFRVDPYLSARGLNTRVLAWLERAREPFFLWVHYMDTHGPYLARKVLKYVSKGERVWRKSVAAPERVTPREREFLRANYRRQIVRLDAELGRLWEVFDRKGLFDRSLVVVTADHGDEFYEHGGYSHSHKLYDELLHVPLLVRLPDGVPGRVEVLTELIQIAPTVLEMAGVEVSGSNGFDAASFLPVLRGAAEAGKPFVLAEAGVSAHDSLAVRTAEWKLIWHGGGKQKELYRLASDPGERENRVSDSPAVVERLETILREHLEGRPAAASLAEFPGEETRQPSEEEERLVVERLRDLGYL
ncbi:MAG: sulfatase [Candidatus Acidoferrales bacterium]